VQTQRHSWGWVVSFTSSLLDPQRKRPHHPKWIIRVTKMGRFRWTERVARWGNNRNTYHILEENVMREYVDVKWIIIHVSKAQCRILWISCFYRRQFSGAFAKLRKATISFVMSVRPPYGKSRLPPDRFSLNLIFEGFSKICRENSSFAEIGRVLYMKTNLHFWSYLVQFLLESEMSQKKSRRESQNTNFVFRNLFSWKIVPFMR